MEALINAIMDQGYCSKCGNSLPECKCARANQCSHQTCGKCQDPNCETCFPTEVLKKASAETSCICDGRTIGCPGCVADERYAKRLRLLAMRSPEPQTAVNFYDRNQTVKIVQNYFRQDPKLKSLVKHVRGGLELVDYYLGVMEAIDKVPSPKGIENEFVISNTNKKRMNELKVVNWVFNVALKAAMGDEKFNPKKGKKRVTTSRHSARS
jgi:hypothetical protein